MVANDTVHETLLSTDARAVLDQRMRTHHSQLADVHKKIVGGLARVGSGTPTKSILASRDCYEDTSEGRSVAGCFQGEPAVTREPRNHAVSHAASAQHHDRVLARNAMIQKLD
jgi:hypothetical protein